MLSLRQYRGGSLSALNIDDWKYSYLLKPCTPTELSFLSSVLYIQQIELFLLPFGYYNNIYVIMDIMHLQKEYFIA